MSILYILPHTPPCAIGIGDSSLNSPVHSLDASYPYKNSSKLFGFDSVAALNEKNSKQQKTKGKKSLSGLSSVIITIIITIYHHIM